MITALLHLQIRPGADALTRPRALPSGTLSRGAGEGRSRALLNPLPHCGRGGTLRVSEGWVRGNRVALGLQLGVVVQDEIDFGEGGVALGRQGRGAAGDDDAGAGVLAAGTADRLSR